MSQVWKDDKSGEQIKEGRSYQIGVWTGPGSEPREPLDFVNVEDLIDVLREALTREHTNPPIEIIVKTWSHYKAEDPRPTWQKGSL